MAHWKPETKDFAQSRCELFDRQILLKLMSFFEKNFAITLVARDKTYENEEGDLRDLKSEARFFSLATEFQIPTFEMVGSHFDKMVAHYGDELAANFLNSLREAGTRPGDLCIILVDPARARPVRAVQLLAPMADKVQVRVCLYVCFPKRLPEGVGGVVVL